MNNSNRMPDKPHIALDENEARRLLEALLEQRTELGDVAEELVRLLLDAGITFPGRGDPDGAQKPSD